MRKIILSLMVLLTVRAFAQEDLTYQQPPQEILGD